MLNGGGGEEPRSAYQSLGLTGDRAAAMPARCDCASNRQQPVQ